MALVNLTLHNTGKDSFSPDRTFAVNPRQVESVEQPDVDYEQQAALFCIVTLTSGRILRIAGSQATVSALIGRAA